MDALKWITTEAKRIRRSHPSMQWKNAVAKASAIYKSKHRSGKKVSGVKRKAVSKKSVTRKKTISKVSGSSENEVMQQIRKTQNEIAKLQEMQKSQMGKKHKGAIVGTIRKKHKKLNSLIKRY